MENKSKKSKAFIITFIVVLLLLIVGYVIFKSINKNTEVASSTGSFWKIFSPLNPNDGESSIVNFPDEYLKSQPTKRVVSQAGEELKKGDVVYIDSFTNNGLPIVKKALASDPKKSIVFGVANENIKTGENGEVTTSGPVNGLDTERNEGTAWTIENQLYLSATIAGEMTKNITIDPSQVFYVGIVAKVDPINGIVNVGGKGTNTSSWVDFSGTVFKNNMNVRLAEAGENLKRGDVVYISGFNSSNLPIVKKAIAGDPVRGIVYGVANNSANTGGLVEVIVGGTVSNLNSNPDDTNPWKVNEQIYLSAKKAGQMTNQINSSYDEGVLVGVIVKFDGGGFTINIGGTGTTTSSWNNFSMDQFGGKSGTNKGAFGGFFGSFGNTLSSVWGSITSTINKWSNSIFGTGIFGGGNFEGGGFGEGSNVCWNGSVNYPKCTIDKDGNCSNGATNPPDCTKGVQVNDCPNGAINPPDCTINQDNKCVNGAYNPPDCTNYCPNEAINYPECTVNIDNKCINGASNPTLCTTDSDGVCLNGASNPSTCSSGIPNPDDIETPVSVIPLCSDGKDNDNDKKIDAQDPGCHVDDDLTKAYLQDKNLEEEVKKPEDKPILNECQVVYENPLVFTTEEREKLDDLLRKFYLISPTLKTEEDIATIYQIYDQKTEFLNRIEKLTKECYLQTNNQTGYDSFCNLGKDFSGKNIYNDACYAPKYPQDDPLYVGKDNFNTAYSGPTTIYGNPWFKYTDRGTYTISNQNTNLFDYYLVKAEENIKKGEQVYVTGGSLDTMFTVKKYYSGITSLTGPYGTATQDIAIGEIGTVSILNYQAITGIGDLHIGDVGYGLSIDNMKDFEVLLNIW